MRVSHYLFVLAAAVAAVTASPAARDGLPWEVFAFVVKATPSEWSQYDWTKITTVGLYDMKPDFIEHANELNVKVVSVTDIDGKKMLNKTYRAEWVRQTVDFAVQHKLNGTNLDFEEEVEAGSEKAQALTDLMTELSAAFKEVMPFSVVSLDVPYAPNCTYNRCFDMEAIAKVADYLVGNSISLISSKFSYERSSIQLWPTTSRAFVRTPPALTAPPARHSRASVSTWTSSTSRPTS